MAINNFGLLQPNQPLTEADKLLADINNFNNTVVPNLPPLVTPPVNVPKYTQFGNKLATLGGFGDQQGELLTQNELSKMNQDQIDAYNKTRKRARTQGIGELLIRFGDALQGKNATQLAYGRQQVRDEEQVKLAYEQAIKIAEASGDFRKANLLRSLGLPGFKKLQQERAIAEFGIGKDSSPASVKEYEFAKQGGYKGSYEDFLQFKKQGDTFNLGNTENVEIVKSRIALGQKDIEETKKALRTTQELIPRLTAAQRILKSDDFKTGPLVEATLGVKKLYADIFGVDVEGLNKQQAFDAFTKFTIPRMRPPGSGATSDFEANLFEQSTASLGKSKKANQIIIGTMLQTARREQQLSMLKEDYFAKNNTTLGFDRYIQKNNLMPKVYIDITNSNQAIELFEQGLLRDGDVYIDFITDPNNPQLAVFDKRDIK